MFSKTAILFTSTLAAIAVASPSFERRGGGGGGGGIPSSDCNTGPVQCCQSTQQASGADATKILGPLGIVLQDLNVLVGLTCNPITVIGTGNSGCSANPVCCENNSFGGLIAIGCVPVNLSL